MIYLFEPKILFYHIPKTAGGSITHWLQRNANTPHALIEPLHMLPWRVKAYNIDVDWSFSVIRNPWDRWVSWWYYWKFIAKRIDYSFEEYTEKFFSGQFQGLPGGEHGTCIPQIHYSRECTDVFRYETLEEDFKRLQDRLQVYTPLAKVANISKSKQQYQSYYVTPRLVDIISDYYKEDIVEYGYKYE